MVPAREDIVIFAGVTFEKVWEMTDEDGLPRDLTAWEGAMTIRDEADAVDVLAEATVECTSAGLVTATITADDTLEMEWYAGYYDLTIESGARVEPVSRGRAVLHQTASR
jgi:uncharacterized protein (DUF2345 family)